MIESWIIEILARSLAFGTPLLLATLGEICAERAGVLNLGVEGMMITGALAAFIVTSATGEPLLGLSAAMLTGATVALVHGALCISLKANQYVSGLALTMFGLGVTSVIGRPWEGKLLPAQLTSVHLDHLERIPLVGPILFTNQNPLVYVAIGLALLTWYVLQRSQLGLAIRAVGENPTAAYVAGISVSSMRYLCVIFGGVMSGLAGAYLAIGYRPAWVEGMTGGMGWLVIAMTIVVFWHPLWAMVGAYFFGGLYYLSFRLQAAIAPEVLQALPYLATILALVLLAKTAERKLSRVPASLGIPFDRDA